MLHVDKRAEAPPCEVSALSLASARPECRISAISRLIGHVGQMADLSGDSDVGPGTPVQIPRRPSALRGKGAVPDQLKKAWDFLLSHRVRAQVSSFGMRSTLWYRVSNASVERSALAG